MTIEVGGMIAAGFAALIPGVVLLRPRARAAAGAGRILVLGPLCDAIALAMFSAEHFTAAHDLAPLVPRWLPSHLFWVYFFGVALLAAAVSFIIGRCVRWSAVLLALFFLIVVATLDVPNMAAGFHQRFFWILTVREMSFAGGAMVLAGSVWPSGWARSVLTRAGRGIVAAVMIFYATQHFLFPLHVPGVPLEKLTPAWMPAAVALDWIVGAALLLGGIGLFIRPAVRMAAASAGSVLILVTVFFYGAMLIAEFHTNPLEGLNYVGDTLLFTGTVLLAGLGTDVQNASNSAERSPLATAHVTS